MSTVIFQISKNFTFLLLIGWAGVGGKLSQMGCGALVMGGADQVMTLFNEKNHTNKSIYIIKLQTSPAKSRGGHQIFQVFYTHIKLQLDPPTVRTFN